jgi:hypothetical protein
MNHLGLDLLDQTAQSLKPKSSRRGRKGIQWDAEGSDIRHIYIFLTIVPHSNCRPIAVSIHSLKEIAKLSL